VKTKKKCFLRKTQIKLADGELYTFTALPFTPKVIKLLKALDKSADEAWGNMETMQEMTRLSLSYSYATEEIDDLFENGIVCMENQTQIMGAIVYQAKKETPGEAND
jgi:hypothetical protein